MIHLPKSFLLIKNLPKSFLLMKPTESNFKKLLTLRPEQWYKLSPYQKRSHWQLHLDYPDRHLLDHLEIELALDTEKVYIKSREEENQHKREKYQKYNNEESIQFKDKILSCEATIIENTKKMIVLQENHEKEIERLKKFGIKARKEIGKNCESIENHKKMIKEIQKENIKLSTQVEMLQERNKEIQNQIDTLKIEKDNQINTLRTENIREILQLKEEYSRLNEVNKKLAQKVADLISSK